MRLATRSVRRCANYFPNKLVIAENRFWWQRIVRHDLLALILLIATGLGAYGALLTPLLLQPGLPLAAGQVATQDFQAPHNAEYISNIRTEEARQAAERAVQPVYTQPDPIIARKQLERLRVALQVIDVTRRDTTATFDQKRQDLSSISDLALRPDTIELLLRLGDVGWQSVENEALNVLERVLRSAVREESLDAVRSNIPMMVSLALSEEQAGLVMELISPFVIPNSFYSQELTDAARLQARQSIQPVTQTYIAGETIVQRGKVLTPANIEALEMMGLIRPSPPFMEYLGAAALVIGVMSFVGLYFDRRRPNFYNESRSLILVAVLFLIFLYAARLTIPNRALIPYIFPLSAFGMLIATLFGPGGGVILSVVIGLLVGYGLPNSLDLTIYYILTSLIGVLSLGKAHRFSAFIWAALSSAAAGVSVITAYRLASGDIDAIGYFQLCGAALLSGMASASLTLLQQYILAEFLGLTTPLRLLDIARPDAPLLQYFLRNAPGTYQHSLLVSNLAEQAAEKLNMDTLLVRVGALYHDVGKAANPSFFIENQMPGNLNPHDDIPPEVAAASVIRHVTDGVSLGKKYRLPRRIMDFMLEHHGTLLARYQYNKAVEQAGGDPSLVDAAKFRYPGPRPRTRETALLMLSDGVEARARSQRPRSEEELRAVVEKTIEFCQKEGQLSETRFTLKDLTIITDSFVTTLMGLYHPRIVYPGSDVSASLNAPTHPTSAEKK